MGQSGKSVYQVCFECYLKAHASTNLGASRHWTILRDKLISQNYRCAYTGEQLVLGINASVDHAFPKKRFPDLSRDPSNIEWVTREINLAKRDLTREEFISMCSKVAHTSQSH